MNLVFWQNMVSIHQSALIKTLSETHNVTLVVQQQFADGRTSSGWSVPDMGDTHIIVDPSAECIKQIFNDHSTATHIFSGINAFPMVYKAFKKATANHCTVIVYAEPYESAGFKGILRRMKYALLNLRFGRRIHAFLATGQTGVKAYRQAGFPHTRIYEWGYFTEPGKTEFLLSPAQHIAPRLRH